MIIGSRLVLQHLLLLSTSQSDMAFIVPPSSFKKYQHLWLQAQTWETPLWRLGFY